MEIDEKIIASLLLQSKAIKLNPAKPFIWASGLKSPIYCDNRITLSFPEIRSTIKAHYIKAVDKYFPNAGAIAGVATGAIAQGALVADAMNLPFVYVRSAPKSHGLENLIEGKIETDQSIVVIEDLVSTGGSSLKAVEVLRSEGCNVLGMVAAFSYGFPFAEENFEKAGCRLITLSDYNVLLDEAMIRGYIGIEDMKALSEWRKDPQQWAEGYS